MNTFSQVGQRIRLVLVLIHTSIPEEFLQLLTWFGFREKRAIVCLDVLQGQNVDLPTV